MPYFEISGTLGPSDRSPRPGTPPRRVAVFALALVFASVASAVAGPRRHVAPGVAREDDTLVLDAAGGEVKLDARGWDPAPEADTDVVVLARNADGARRIRVFDRRGRLLGEYAAPDGWVPIGTDGGIVLVPEALHEPITPHALRFLSHAGELRKEVHEPALRLHGTRIVRGGALVTVSAVGNDDRSWTVRAYGADGTELWSHDASGLVQPEALVTVAGRRLVVLERDHDAGISRLTIFRSNRRPKSYRLPLVGQLVTDPGSARVAAVGEGVVAVVDTETRKLKWRRDARIERPIRGGVRFDRRAPRLFVVSADENRKTRKARLRLRTYRLSDGAAERGDLGEVPVDGVPPVVDVEAAPEGGRRVLVPDRAIIATPEGGAP